MNRRKKKKQPSVNYIELLKEKCSSIDWLAMKDTLTTGWSGLPKLHQRALIVIVPVVLLLILIPFPESKPDEAATAPQRVEIDINTTGLSEQKNARQQQLASNDWKEYEVKSGDTLAQVFRSNNLAMSDLNALVKVEGTDKPLSYIKQGQLVRFKLTDEGQLDILQLEKKDQSVMFFRLSDGGFGRSK
tara:strand:- start:2686 stop:3249 length:564 start_codon:yes stop_codon:yes gene_type:complete